MLGLAAVAASWALGSIPLAVVGFGFAFVALTAHAWKVLARGLAEVERRVLAGERIEGADLVVAIRAGRKRHVLVGAVSVTQRLGEEVRSARLGAAGAEITFSRVARGRQLLERLEVSVSDPFGLEQVDHQSGEREAVLIRPRVPNLDSIFSARGAYDAGAARAAVRSPSGFEFRTVREHAPGDPLRAVHWPSTARRGRLIVKELNDTPRDELVVVLDQDETGCAGPPGASSFDMAVRAAGAVALAHVRQRRDVLLIGTASTTGPARIQGSQRDWERALDYLAEVMPEACAGVGRFLGDRANPVSGSRDLVVVTGRPERAVEALLEARRQGRAVSLVAIAAETFVGRPRDRASASLLRVAAAGIPVAVVTADSALEDALAFTRPGAVSA